MPVAPCKAIIGALAGDDCGVSDSGPALVLLHGLTFDRRTWVPGVEALRALQPTRRVLALDLPGHGESPRWQSYPMDAVIAAIHESVLLAGIEAPVMVGHSLGAVVAFAYATRYATRGVVNVDQTLDVAPFMRLLQSLRAPLEGPGFPMVWARMVESFHLERLSPADRQKVEEESDPRQELVVGYWREALDAPPATFTQMVIEGIEQGRERGRRYTIVVGEDLEVAEADWLARTFPEATVVIIPGSGHFPHIAHPEQFAETLAATSVWANRPQASTVA
jgi:pimeloyl-ACP methyl ester carboxylesterase